MKCSLSKVSGPNSAVQPPPKGKANYENQPEQNSQCEFHYPILPAHEKAPLGSQGRGLSGYNLEMPSRAPLITAVILLLLPVLYVGSYLALVRPGRGGHFRQLG